MIASLDVPKSDPAVIGALALDGVAAGAPEVVADEISRADLTALYSTHSLAGREVHTRDV